ncbi:cyanate hydratase [Aureococcus anophagefferens]|nr:cyanate hydratase [Aureococcus anophagefferens]
MLGLALRRSSCIASTVPRRALAPATRSFASPPIGDLAERLMASKKATGKTFDEIADGLGWTNASPAAVPGISAEDLDTLEVAPMRGFDDEILKEPNVYRTYEAITHYGNAIKLLINEKFGDGIMSAIDFYFTVGSTVGKQGERRVVLTFNGKFLRTSSRTPRTTRRRRRR